MKKRIFGKKAKLLCAVFITVMILTQSACASGNINDRETGDIILGEKKYSYTDGTYVAHSAFYNDSGCAYAMLIKVENGLINTVYFDRFDTALNAYSLSAAASDSESSEHFGADVKSLCTSLLQEQTYRTNVSSSDPTPYEFAELAKACTENASAGNFAPIAVHEEQTYTASVSSVYYPVISSLGVRYTNSEISQIDFYQTNPDGNKLTNYPPNPDGSIADRDYSYSDQINSLNAIPEDRITLHKAGYLPAGEALFADYNALCSAILAKREAFAPDVYSLFSSR